MDHARQASLFGNSVDTGTRRMEIPIAQLDTTTPPLPSSTITAIVALIFPYSSHTRSAALLLADPDMRQRSRMGQVRVQFHGAAAVAFADAHIGSGDEIHLCLEGARWVEEDVSAVHTPGRSVDKELAFERRIMLSASRDGQAYARLDVTVPAPSSPSVASSETREPDSGSHASVGSAVAVTPSFARAQSRMNLGFDAYDDVDVTGPIVFDDAGYDPFLDDGSTSPRKRTKLGRKSGEWKLVGWDDSGRESPSKSVADGTVSEAVHFPGRPVSPHSPSGPVSQEVKSLMVDTSGADAPHWAAQPEAIMVEHESPILNPSSISTNRPESIFVDLISPETDEMHPQQPEVFGNMDSAADVEAQQTTTATATTTGSLPVLAAHQVSESVTESVGHVESHQYPAQDLKDNKSSPRDSISLAITQDPFISNITENAISQSPPQSHSALNIAVEHSVSALQEFTPDDKTSELGLVVSAPASKGQQDFGAKSALVEPLFGPLVPTLPINERHEELKERNVNRFSPGEELLETEGTATPSILVDDKKETSPFQDQLHSFTSGQVVLQSKTSHSPSTAPELQGFPTIHRSSPGFDLPLNAQPELSATFVDLTSSMETPLTPQDVPDEPLSSPTMSLDLPLVLPLPTSSANASAFPQSTAQTNQSGEALSTPATTQMDSDLQLWQNPTNSQSKIMSPTMSVIEDPGAPPDTTMMPDDWTRAVDFGIEHVSSPIRPATGIEVDHDAQTSSLDHLHQTDLLKPERSVSQTEEDLHGANVMQALPILRHNQHVNLDDGRLIYNEPPIDGTNDFAENKLHIEQTDAIIRSEQKNRVEANNVQSSTAEGNGNILLKEKSHSPTVSRRTSRHSAVPEALSKFFQAMPPRRSDRHRESMKRAPQEFQEKLHSEQVLEKDYEQPEKTPALSKHFSGDTDSSAKISILHADMQPEHVKERLLQPVETLDEKLDGKDSKADEAITVTLEESIALVHSRSGGFRTPLSYYAALKNVDVYLNASSSESQGPSIDIFVVVTSDTTSAARAKAGPKHQFTTMEVTDASLTNRAMKVECFRPHKSALPIAHTGDILLFREPVVRSNDGQVYLLSGGSSAWRVWHFCQNAGSHNTSQECRGPPVEVGPEEQEHARALHEWWLSICDNWQNTNGKQLRMRKKSVSQRSGRQKGSPEMSKKNKSNQPKASTIQADSVKAAGRGTKGHQHSNSRS